MRVEHAAGTESFSGKNKTVLSYWVELISTRKLVEEVLNDLTIETSREGQLVLLMQ